MKNEIFKDIKSCRFCGSKVEVHHASYNDGVFGHFCVRCPRCGLIDVTPIDDKCNPEPRLDAYFDVWQHRGHEDEDDLK